MIKPASSQQLPAPIDTERNAAFTKRPQKVKTISELCQRYIQDGVLGQVERYVKFGIVNLTSTHLRCAKDKCLQLVQEGNIDKLERYAHLDLLEITEEITKEAEKKCILLIEKGDHKKLKRYYKLGLIDDFFNKKIHPHEVASIAILRKGGFHFVKTLINDGVIDEPQYWQEVHVVTFSNFFFHPKIPPCPRIALYILRNSLCNFCIDHGDHMQKFDQETLDSFIDRLKDNCELLIDAPEEIYEESYGFPFFHYSTSPSLYTYGGSFCLNEAPKLSTCNRFHEVIYSIRNKEETDITDEERAIIKTKFPFPFIANSLFLEFAVLFPFALTRIQGEPITLENFTGNYILFLQILKWIMINNRDKFLVIDANIQPDIDSFISACDVCFKKLRPTEDPKTQTTLECAASVAKTTSAFFSSIITSLSLSNDS